MSGRDPDQAWFWTPAWQAGEIAADRQIAAGETGPAMSTEEFLSWLDQVQADDGKEAKP